MSYIFLHSSLYEDIMYHIYKFSKKPDRLQISPTSIIVKPIFTIRKYLQNNTIENIIICTLYSNLPKLWLLNTLSKEEWDEQVTHSINNNKIF